MASHCAGLWGRLLLGLLLAARARGGSKLQNKADKARKKGIKGYDLIDAIDPFWGDDTPRYEGPKQVLDAIGDGNGRVTAEDWKRIGLPEDHFSYFDKNSDGIMDAAECNSWWLQRKPAKTMDLSEVHNPPKGHLERLFSWKDPLPSDDLVYKKPYPHPRDFWSKHMDGYLPANLKGAQLGWPAMNWTREVLAERFGWVDAKLEPKVEGRGNTTAYKDLDTIAPRHRLNISEYLRVEAGVNMYVVSIIPQVMAWEVAHPSVLLCGSRRKMVDRRSAPPYKLGKHEYPHEKRHDWMTHLFEANLWIASGRTRSQFHYDKEWNVNCLLSGRKRWVFLNSFWYDEDLQWARGNKFKRTNPLNNAWTDWVFLDPDHVDLIVQHKMRDMDYYELIQEAGDCIFIPYAMLHQVEKLGDDLQVAVSWMFLPETIYDEEVCKEAPLEEDLPLAVMDTLYMYTGKGIIPQGYADPRMFVDGLARRMKERKVEYLTLDAFTSEVSRGGAILATVKDRKKKIKKIFKLLTSYASNPDRGLRSEELHKIPLRLWCKPAAEGDDEGPLPCDVGQEYEFCDDAEFKKMDDYVRQQLSKTAAASRNPPTPEAPQPTHRRVYPSGRSSALAEAAAARQRASQSRQRPRPDEL